MVSQRSFFDVTNLSKSLCHSLHRCKLFDLLLWNRIGLFLCLKRLCGFCRVAHGQAAKRLFEGLFLLLFGDFEPPVSALHDGWVVEVRDRRVVQVLQILTQELRVPAQEEERCGQLADRVGKLFI